MDEPRTASALNIEQMEIGQAYNKMCMHPDQQAQAIAQHYVAHAQVAKDLLILIDMRDDSLPTDVPDINNAIAYFVAFIKKNHRHDFGIELEWSKEKL